MGAFVGSSLFGWALGVVFGGFGWLWFLAAVVAMGGITAAIAAMMLRPGRVSVAAHTL